MPERLTRLAQPRTDPSRGFVDCPLCGSPHFEVLGVRGNREHTGADPAASPHIWTNVARCARCDFVFANPPIPEAAELEAAHYGDASTYDATESVARTRAMFRARLMRIGRYVQGGRLLDVGAGKGEFLREAREAGYEVEGVEPSADFCEFAAHRYGLRVHHGVLGLGEAPAIRERSFDVVTLNHVLEHVARPLDLLDLLRHYQRSGGVLFVEVPNVDANLARATDLWFRLRGRDWSCRLSPVHPPFHSYGYTPRSLRWALERSGWDVLEMTTRSGRDRGISKRHPLAVRAAVGGAFLAFSALGNRELLLAIARPG